MFIKLGKKKKNIESKFPMSFNSSQIEEFDAKQLDLKRTASIKSILGVVKRQFVDLLRNFFDNAEDVFNRMMNMPSGSISIANLPEYEEIIKKANEERKPFKHQTSSSSRR